MNLFDGTPFEAEQLLQESLASSPDRAVSLHELGIVSRMRNDLAQAEAYFRATRQPHTLHKSMLFSWLLEHLPWAKSFNSPSFDDARKAWRWRRARVKMWRSLWMSSAS